MQSWQASVSCVRCMYTVGSARRRILRGAPRWRSQKENVPHAGMLKIQKKNVNLAIERKNMTKHVGHK